MSIFGARLVPEKNYLQLWLTMANKKPISYVLEHVGPTEKHYGYNVRLCKRVPGLASGPFGKEDEIFIRFRFYEGDPFHNGNQDTL